MKRPTGWAHFLFYQHIFTNFGIDIRKKCALWSQLIFSLGLALDNPVFKPYIIIVFVYLYACAGVERGR